MLLTLAFATVITAPTNASQVVVRGDMTYATQPMHVHNETMTDPDDPNKTVTAKVSYSVTFRIHVEDEPDDYIVSRRVRTRPERPARSFQMSEMRMSIEDNPDNIDSIKDLAATLNMAGIPGSNAPIFRRALQAMRQISVEQVYGKPQTINPNIGIKPGGWTEREYGYDIYYTDLHMQLYKKVEIPGRPSYEVPIGSEEIYDLYEYWIPVPMIRERFIPDPARNTMSFGHLPDGYGGLQFTPEYSNLIGSSYVTLPSLKSDIRYVQGSKGVSTTATNYRNDVLSTLPNNGRDIMDIIKLAPKTMDDMLNGAAGQGNNMNSLNVPGDISLLGAPRCGSEMYMPPGTVWIPSTPGYQIMMNTTPLRYQFDALYAKVGGLPQSANARTHCLNKDLKEPEPGVRYFPYMNNDEILVELAKKTAESNFRGPWDQVRTWIYTDKVSLDDANKVIVPPVSPAQYVNGLFDVQKLGGLDAKDLANKNIFSPSLLNSATLLDEAFNWVSMRVGEVAGKELRKWIEGMPADIQRMLKSPANDFEKKHAPRLFKSMLSSLNPDTRMGALNALDKNPELTASLKGQIGDFEASVYSANETESKLATKLAPMYQ